MPPIRIVLIDPLVVQVGRERHVSRSDVSVGIGEIVTDRNPAGPGHIAFAILHLVRRCSMIGDTVTGRTRLVPSVRFSHVEDAMRTLFRLAQDVGFVVAEVGGQGVGMVDEERAFGVLLIHERRDAVQLGFVAEFAA